MGVRPPEGPPVREPGPALNNYFSYGSDSIDFDCEQRMRAVQRASPARSAQDDMSYLHGM